MTLAPELASRFAEFVGKWSLGSKLEAELSKKGLSLAELKADQATVLLPFLFELAGELAEAMPEELREGLVSPEFKQGEKLTEDLVGETAEFILAASGKLGEEKTGEMVAASIAAVSEELFKSYQAKTV